MMSRWINGNRVHDARPHSCEEKGEEGRAGVKKKNAMIRHSLSCFPFLRCAACGAQASILWTCMCYWTRPSPRRRGTVLRRVLVSGPVSSAACVSITFAGEKGRKSRCSAGDVSRANCTLLLCIACSGQCVDECMCCVHAKGNGVC